MSRCAKGVLVGVREATRVQRRGAHRDARTLGLSYIRDQSTLAPVQAYPKSVTSVLPSLPAATKVVFDNQKSAEYKHIWLRDNCRCPQCVDPATQQKLLDTPSLDVNIRPESVAVESGSLRIEWPDHVSTYTPEWLYKYGQSFMNKTFEGDLTDLEVPPARSPRVLWDKELIWKQFPKMSYEEFMSSDQGLLKWLDMFHKYGLAMLEGVPTEKGHLDTVVERFAYLKETAYGRTFDVINVPTPGTHPAYSGAALAYHTDMNYREKSPGMQLLHCLKSSSDSAEDLGGKSMYVDGFRAARWMEEHEPTAFHILTSTAVRFSITNAGRRYSTSFPVITCSSEGVITEIHYNNRTMQPLQAPPEMVAPFYHAYKLFTQILTAPEHGLEFNMKPGDLMAFNNRRALHARSSYDAAKMDRHLHGCYVDIDEAYSKYDQLLTPQH